MGRRTRKSRRFWERGWFVTLALTLALGASTLGAKWVAERALPDVSRLRSSFPVIRYMGQGKPFQVEWTKSRPAHWVSIGSISRAMIGAVIVSEDSAFFQHEGFDTQAIRDVLEESIKEGEFTRGASTITQQVAKNVFLSHERSLLRKLREAALTVELESNFKKRQILEVYFNIAEWGPGIFGIAKASQYYFGKTPSELRAREAAFLAMLLPSPIRYGQSFRRKELTAFARRRINDVTRKLVQTGVITAEERERDLNQPFSWEKTADSHSASPPEAPQEGDEESWFTEAAPKEETVGSESQDPEPAPSE